MLGKELLNLKAEGSKLDQILCADKTGIRRLGHKYVIWNCFLKSGHIAISFSLSVL